MEKLHVIISGGSRGRGEALVADLLAAGYRVSTFSRTTTPFIQKTLAERPRDFAFLQADLRNPASLSDFVARAASLLGPPYGLINNAGVAVDGVLATMPPAEIEQALAINLQGTILLTREVVRRMLLHPQGRVLNTSSVIGTRGFSGLAAYSATKAGLDGFTRALARELGPRGITVNSVAPGYLETEMTGGLSPGQRAQIGRRTPLGRLGTQEDVTGVVRFLLSDEARFITGQVLVVDGDLTC